MRVAVALVMLFLCGFAAIGSTHYDTFILSQQNAFKLKILYKISTINYDIDQEQDKERLEDLISERNSLIRLFLHRLDTSQLEFQNNAEDLERKKMLLIKLHEYKQKEEVLPFLTVQILINSIQLDIAFENFLSRIWQYNHEFRTKEEYEALFLNYSESVVFSDQVFDQMYQDLIKKTGKTPVELKYIQIYQEYINKQDVLNSIFNYLKERTFSVLSTNTILDYLGIVKVISSIDSLEIFREYDDDVKTIIGITVGQVIVAVALFLLIISLQSVVDRWLIRLLRRFFDNTATQSAGTQKKIQSFEYCLGQSLHKPIRYFLFLFALDIALRVVFIAEDNAYIVNYFELSYIILGAWTLVQLINNFVMTFSANVLEKYPNVRGEMVNLIVNFFKILVAIFALIMILSKFGYDVSGILASLGVGGLVIAFAARESIADLFGSISIIMDNMFSQGDWIVIGDTNGVVVDVGIRSTKVRTWDNSLVFIPNSSMANAKIVNWDKREVGRLIELHIGVMLQSKKEDLENAVDQIAAMLDENEYISSEGYDLQKLSEKQSAKIILAEEEFGVKNDLFVAVDRLTDHSIEIFVYCFSKSTSWGEWLKIKQQVIFDILEIVRQNDLQLAAPLSSLQLKKENIDINLFNKKGDEQ